jgi:hypothetical protein
MSETESEKEIASTTGKKRNWEIKRAQKRRDAEREPVTRVFYRLQPKHSNLLLLACLWAICLFLCFITWAQWADITIDVGREMYVPIELNKGRILFRDVIYQYGPLIPYWHALLFRIFGIHLYVLYSASLIVILTIVTLLFRIGCEFADPIYAFTAGLAFLLEGYERGVVFTYGLPYSFPAIYSSLAMVLMMYLGILLIKKRGGRKPLFWAALTSALTLLIKQEFGVFSLVFLIVLLVVRCWQHRSVRALVHDVLLCVPPMLVAAGVYLYFCSLGGLKLLLEENFASAPQHYFTKHYGAVWADVAGMRITTVRLYELFKNAIKIAVFWTIWIFVMRWIASQLVSRFPRSAALLFAIVCALSIAAITIKETTPLHPTFAFPNSMYAFVAVLLILTGWRLKKEVEPSLLARAFLVFGALVVAFRTCTSVRFYEYPIYYNPLLYLCALILLALIVGRAMAGRSTFEQRAMKWGTITLLWAGLAGASLPNYAHRIPSNKMLETRRGKMVVYPGRKAAPYKKTLAFLEWVKANGRSAMILPEDTSLYFFAEISAPSRFYALTPGMIAPGAITDGYLRDLARAQVDYIVLTNRPTPEYGAPYFGIDFDQSVLQWIDAHYNVVGEIGQFAHHPNELPWGALIYRRRGLAPVGVPAPLPGTF